MGNRAMGNRATLSRDSRAMVNRQLFRIELSDTPFPEEKTRNLRRAVRETWPEAGEEATAYLLTSGVITNNAYIPEHDKIHLLYKDGKVSDIAESSDQLNISVLTSAVSKHFITYPKSIHEM